MTVSDAVAWPTEGSVSPLDMGSSFCARPILSIMRRLWVALGCGESAPSTHNSVCDAQETQWPICANLMVAPSSSHSILLGGKWKVVILARLKQQPMRYGDLRLAIPDLSDKVLTDRLAGLRATGPWIPWSMRTASRAIGSPPAASRCGRCSRRWMTGVRPRRTRSR